MTLSRKPKASTRPAPTRTTSGNAALKLIPDSQPGALIRVGGLPAGVNLAQSFRLPVLPFGPAAYVVDALDQAVTERKIIALVGDRGVGKTMAVDGAVRGFDEAEVIRRSQDASLPSRIVVRVRSPRSKRRLDTLDVIHYRVTGAHLETRERGRAIAEDILIETVAHQLMNAQCVTLVFDEAEQLSDAGLAVVRDIVAFAEARSDSRYVDSTPGDTSDARQYMTAGIGVLLVGTTELKHRLTHWEEAGRRLLRIREVPGLTSKQAATAYRAFLPCLEHAASEMGDAAWTAFVRARFAPTRVPFAHVENHVRHYVRRVLNTAPDIQRLDDIPFLEDVFVAMWNERAAPVVHTH
jgi:type II secretory pathway predicted ATPase ExeA